MGSPFSKCVCLDYALCSELKHKCICVKLWECRNFYHNTRPKEYKGLSRCCQIKINYARSEWCIGADGKEIECRAGVTPSGVTRHKCICTTTRCHGHNSITGNPDCKAKVHTLKEPYMHLE